jgi:hypothetical protein
MNGEHANDGDDNTLAAKHTPSRPRKSRRTSEFSILGAERQLVTLESYQRMANDSTVPLWKRRVLSQLLRRLHDTIEVQRRKGRTTKRHIARFTKASE